MGLVENTGDGEEGKLKRLGVTRLRVFNTGSKWRAGDHSCDTELIN